MGLWYVAAWPLWPARVASIRRLVASTDALELGARVVSALDDETRRGPWIPPAPPPAQLTMEVRP